MALTPSDLRAWCLAMPGAVEELPFGPETSVFKIAVKIFALCALGSAPLKVSLKCDPELAANLRDSYDAVVPGYHLNKRHWITITLEGDLPAASVRDLIEDSYDLVLPAAVRRARGDSNV